MLQGTRWTDGQLYRSAYPQRSQNKEENVTIGNKAYDILPQNRIMECLKKYKITDKVINFITKAKENLKVELAVRGPTLAEIKIQRGILQWDSLSPLIFVKAMMTLNYLFREFTTDHKFTKSQEKINHFI